MYDLIAQTTTYTTTPSAEDAAAAAAGTTFLLALGCIGLIIGIICYVVISLSVQKIATRMKIADPWWAWVPILNIFLMAKMAGFETWYGVLGVFFPPFIYVFYYKILIKLGKPDWHLVFVLLIPILYIPYLAFFDKE